jgi:hypothetical protein
MTPVGSRCRGRRGMVAAVSWVSCAPGCRRAPVPVRPLRAATWTRVRGDVGPDHHRPDAGPGPRPPADGHLAVPARWARTARWDRRRRRRSGLLTAPTATASSMQPSDVRDERILPSPAPDLASGPVDRGRGSSVQGSGSARSPSRSPGSADGARVFHGVHWRRRPQPRADSRRPLPPWAYYHSATVEFVLLPSCSRAQCRSRSTRWPGAVARRVLWREFELRLLVIAAVTTAAC